jgi:hypothetical protein
MPGEKNGDNGDANEGRGSQKRTARAPCQTAHAVPGSAPGTEPGTESDEQASDNEQWTLSLKVQR